MSTVATASGIRGMTMQTHRVRIFAPWILCCVALSAHAQGVQVRGVRGPAGPDESRARAEIEARGLEFTAHEFVGVAGAGESEHIVLFLDGGMDPEASDDRGQTALIAAAYEGMNEVVTQLLDAGASPDSADRYGATPLLYAASEGYEGIVGTLLERGADPNGSDAVFGRTPLMVAALEGHADIAARLIAAGAEVDAQSMIDASTSLMLAASHGRENVVTVLLKHRCDRKKKDRLGRTAEDLARLQGHMDLARRVRAGR